jgi:chaperonin GroES
MKINLEEEISKGLNIEQFNIASKLDEDELKKIAEEVYNGYTSDEDSRSDWLQKHTEWKKLYNQTDTPVNKPWESSSEESVPILTEACNSFQARAYKAFFPTRKFLDAIPYGQINEQTLERAERIAKHMSFQLGILMPNYKPDKNAMFLASALNGSDFTKTYYNPIFKQNVVERVRAVDLVCPYSVGPIRIEDLPRKTHVIYKTLNETNILKQSKYFIASCGKHELSSDEYQDAENDYQGIRPTGSEGLDYAKVLEQHTLLDLDGDGIKEPYIVWIDYETKKCLRIQIRYEVDEYGQPKENKKPIEYFDHYKFLENPDGFYGYGYGHLIGNLNMAINKMLRQSIDAATLANMGMGFVDDQADVKGGPIEMQLGKFVKIANFKDKIGDAFFRLEFPGANAGLVTLMNSLENYARSLSSVTDAVTGDAEKVYQPVTIMTMLEQSLQMPTSIMEQMAVTFQSELEKLYKLNRKYLSQEAYFNENGQSFQVTQEDYIEDLKLVPIFDPRNITKQQKVSKAQALYEFVMNNPLTAQDKNSIYEASKKMLEALEIDDIQDILPEPTEAPEPQRIDDQHQENMYFLMPPQDRPLFDVFPEQDHAQHIKVIDELLNGPFAEEISKDILPAIQDHRKKHVAYLYMQNQIRLQQYAQGSIGAMDAQSINPEALQGADGSFQMQGQSDLLSEIGGLTQDTGTMGGGGNGSQDNYRTEAGFLENLLPKQQ